MTDIVLGITLKADASGFVGEVKLGQGELDKLGGTAKRAGEAGTKSVDAMGGALGRIRGLALGAVAGFAGFNSVQRLIGQVKDEILATERASATLGAVIRATGGAAGLSAAEIGRMADQLERTTLFDDNAIKQSAAVLLTFRNIGRDVFGETLSLATDLSALMGGDLQGAVLQLGKALQDPVEGLTALRRSGISFSEQQQDVIKSLVETGRQGEAMRIILDEVARQVGGVAKSQVTGLTGAVNDLEDAWGDLLKTFADTGGFDLTLGALTLVTQKIRDLIDTGPELEDWLDLLSFAPISLLAGENFSWSDLLPDDLFEESLDEAIADVARLRSDLQALRDLPPGQASEAELTTVEGRLDRAEARLQHLLLASNQGQGSSRAHMPTGSALLYTPPRATGGGPSDEELKKLEERAELIRQFHLEQVVQQEEDLANAFKRSAAMIEEMNDATAEAIDRDRELGETLRQELLTPQEAYNESLAEYRRLLDEGAISQETFTRAVKKAGEELEAANDDADSLGDTMKVVSQQAVHAFEDWIATGGDVHDMLGALEEDLIRLAYRALVFKPLEDAADSFFGEGGGFADFIGSIFGAIFGGASGPGPGAGPEIRHAGGVVGSAGAPRRRMPAAVFAHAPRYHAGGTLGPDEVPIVGKRGEVIGWPQQMRQAFGGGDTQVVINNYSGQSGRAEERQGGDGRRLIEVTIGEAVGKDLRNRGPVAQQLEQNYGLARRGTVRG